MDILKLSNQELNRFIRLQAIHDRQQAAAEKVRVLRAYYYGDHEVPLTARQKAYLGVTLTSGEFSFAHNLMRTIVDTLRERLEVSGFVVDGKSADDLDENGKGEPAAILSGKMWEWWLSNKMPAQQIRIYRRALRDGKGYVIVSFDNDTQRPRFSPHRVDDGDKGITYHRNPADMEQVLFACKYFSTFNILEPGQTGKQRRTVYLPHEVRKYIEAAAGDWQPYQDEDDATWPISWVDSKGLPLGVAVHEFQNPGGSEIEQLVGLQNALNKAWLDLLAGADTAGFPIPVVEYDEPMGSSGAADNDEELPFEAGHILEVFGGRAHRLDPANLSPMIETIWTVVTALSGVSRTPQYYLRPIGGSDVPSGEALKQLESGLVKRAEERHLMFGDTWAEIMGQAYSLAKKYGPNNLPDIKNPTIEVMWADPNTRNESALADAAIKHKQLDVPNAKVWEMLGYSPSAITEFREQERNEKAAEVATIIAAMQASWQEKNSVTIPDGEEF